MLHEHFTLAESNVHFRHAIHVLESHVDVVHANDLQPGDMILVRPGERIPADGDVISGRSAVDEAMFTGESLLVDKEPGSPVFGGTLNQSGAVRLRVTKTGSSTALSRIVQAVEQAQGSRAPIARLADVARGVYSRR